MKMDNNMLLLTCGPFLKTDFCEINKNVISIMNIYIAKNNGLRKYKHELTK